VPTLVLDIFTNLTRLSEFEKAGARDSAGTDRLLIQAARCV
jgi:hypothetical protein